jgi:hypothetical protein
LALGKIEQKTISANFFLFLSRTETCVRETYSEKNFLFLGCT